MTVFINPGSGPVEGATLEDARKNVAVFMLDVRDAYGVAVFVADEPSIDEGDGRWGFRLNVGGRWHELEMPGLPLERVRYVDEDDQNIWDFPRLYVDGSSWVWEFAVGVIGREDDE